MLWGFLPYSLLDVDQHFGGMSCLLSCMRSNSSKQLAFFAYFMYFFTLKMEAVVSKMSVNSHQTSQLHIPDYITHGHCWENLCNYIMTCLLQLETVIQQECEGLATSHPPVPPCSLDLQLPAQRNNGGTKCLGLPSLPEPTEPPPPPPTGPSGVPVCTDDTSPPQSTTSEPIYESVLPRDEGGEGDICDPSPPPLPTPGPHKLRPKSPGVERIQRGNHGHSVDRVPSPRPRPGSPSCSSPRHSRPSSRGSSVSGVSTSPRVRLGQTATFRYTVMNTSAQ
jgi:hypothetical protein